MPLEIDVSKVKVKSRRAKGEETIYVRSDGRSEGSMTCVICASTDVVQIHCKIRCMNCGLTRDCGDP